MPAVPAALRLPPEGRLFLVQFRTIGLPEWRQALAALGAEVLNFFPHNAHIVRIDPGLVQRVAELAFVERVEPYHPAYRLDAELRDWALAPADRSPRRVQRDGVRVGTGGQGARPEGGPRLGRRAQATWCPSGHILELWVDAGAAPAPRRSRRGPVDRSPGRRPETTWTWSASTPAPTGWSPLRDLRPGRARRGDGLGRAAEPIPTSTASSCTRRRTCRATAPAPTASSSATAPATGTATRRPPATCPARRLRVAGDLRRLRRGERPFRAHPAAQAVALLRVLPVELLGRED